MRSILVFAIALLSAAVCCAQEATDLKALKEILQSDREDRFEQGVRFVERSDREEDRTAAFNLIVEARGVLWKIQQGYYQTLPREEAEKQSELLLKPLEPVGVLIYLNPKMAGDLARSLFTSSRSERIQRIKQLALESGEDGNIPDDDTTLGSLGCGTYDHTREFRIGWAARRYRDEALQALGQKVGWNGRVELMDALGDGDPRLKDIFIRLSEDRNTLVRGRAIMGLAAFPGEEAQAIAVRGLTNKAADTRAKSMWLAHKLKMRTLEAEAIRLVDDPVDQVGKQALMYLASLGTPRAKMTLIKALNDEDLFFDALGAIGECNCVEASPYLVKLLAKKGGQGPGAVLNTLYSIDSLAGTEELEKAFKSDDEDLLETAINIATANKLQNARAALNRIVARKDINEWVRKAALYALEELDK